MLYTRSYLAHSTNIMSEFISKLGKKHWNIMKWLLKYVKATLIGLVYGRDARIDPILNGFVDSN